MARKTVRTRQSVWKEKKSEERFSAHSKRVKGGELKFQLSSNAAQTQTDNSKQKRKKQQRWQ